MAELKSNGPGSRGSGRSGRRSRSSEYTDSDGENQAIVETAEKVIFINRSAKVVKGGRRFSFSALVAAGDKQGRIGLGLGKAGEVADAIRKAGELAKHHMTRIALKDSTIPHEVLSDYDGARVLLRPASPGTGIIAGKTVRAVLELAGIRNVLSKSLGSKNATNVAKATITALQQLRLREDVYRNRGLSLRPSPPADAAPPATPTS